MEVQLLQLEVAVLLLFGGHLQLLQQQVVPLLELDGDLGLLLALLLLLFKLLSELFNGFLILLLTLLEALQKFVVLLLHMLELTLNQCKELQIEDEKKATYVDAIVIVVVQRAPAKTSRHHGVHVGIVLLWLEFGATRRIDDV